MGSYQWYVTKKREEMLEKLKELPEYGKRDISEILEVALEEFLLRHSKSNNPQSQITTYTKDTITGIPQIYQILENPSVFDQFYKKLTEMDYKYLDKAINELLRKHNKVYREGLIGGMK